MVALRLIFNSRLPAEARDYSMNVIQQSLFFAGAVLALVAFRRDNRSGFALETLLPMSLAFAGWGLFAVAGTVVINLDAHSYLLPFDSPAGIPIMMCGAFLGYWLGRCLGSAWAIGRLRREAATSRRVAWLAEVDADRSWRLLVGRVWAVPYVLLIVLIIGSPQHSPTHSLVFAGFLALTWAVGIAAGQQASVFITDAGVRVSGRPPAGAPSWSLSLAKVASVRVITARPSVRLRPSPRCVLRSGPALEVKSTAGSAYVVSLPDAQEAASVLIRLIEQARGETVPPPAT
jgi:hypothetical protein